MICVAAVVALSMLGAKFLLRLFTRPEAIVRGDEVQDTVLWFVMIAVVLVLGRSAICLLYTSPSPRDRTRSRMPSSA